MHSDFLLQSDWSKFQKLPIFTTNVTRLSPPLVFKGRAWEWGYAKSKIEPFNLTFKKHLWVWSKWNRVITVVFELIKKSWRVQWIGMATVLSSELSTHELHKGIIKQSKGFIKTRQDVHRGVVLYSYRNFNWASKKCCNMKSEYRSKMKSQWSVPVFSKTTKKECPVCQPRLF